MDEKTPALTKTAFACPHCKAHSQQQWYQLGAETLNEPPGAWDVGKVREFVKDLPKTDEKADTEKYWLAIADRIERGEPTISDGEYKYMKPILNAHVSKCFSCAKETLWLGERVVFPAHSADIPEANADLPVAVKRDYDEAALIRPLSPRAAAALLRLALQKLCAHLLGRDDDINKMIGALVKQGLSPKIQKALDVVRVIGNEAVHPGTLDLRDDVEITSSLFGLINLIAETMISVPKHVDDLYSIIPAPKLKGIEERDRKASQQEGPGEDSPE
jgi:hypothetical protein